MANRLAHETSPYLLQHAGNPVDWWPWGEAAAEAARASWRPILLSVGYSSCHWCHVMERESFDDETTAALMNEHFVCVKVDREERPDVDAIYMQAVQAMTGHGGWPMTVFLTPDGVPFYGGTYFPPEDRQGTPSFRRVLEAVAEAWREKPDQVRGSAEQMRQLYASTQARAQPSGAIDAVLLERAARGLAAQFDERHAGFGRAPKFPPTMALDFLLRRWARTGHARTLAIVHRTFLAMARGGLFDQVGGGFARYSVDERWRTPHWEKMLYDNALLARLGVHVWQALGSEPSLHAQRTEVRRVSERTFAWVLREMRAPGGGFCSALDADSEGEEGKFYLWDAAELDALLGGDARAARAYWGVGDDGEGRSILHVPRDLPDVARELGMTTDALREAIDRAHAVLYAARARRVWPARDDKVIASWNAHLLRALAEGARAFDDETLRIAALETGAFLWRELVRGAGAETRVARSHRAGTSRGDGFLEDHAGLGLAALALWELTFDAAWLRRARALADAVVARFWDEAAGSFFDTAHDHEALVARPRDAADNATPAGGSLAAELLARLGDLLGDADMMRRATWVLETIAEPMARYPLAFGHALGVADLLVHGATELAILGDPASSDFRALSRVAAARYLPSLVVAGGDPSLADEIPILAERPLRDGRATAYLCRGWACEEPVSEPGELERLLRRVLREA